jgi:splicing factor 3B subunit 2
VHLKAYRNTVPVPRHWCHKRKYLQGKRGIEKPPFQLPDFITATGISKLRGADVETEAAKKLKAKSRERITPKMGRIEIDYDVLHDAFFKYQTKPSLSRFGDLYYEGKEFELTGAGKRPGVLSERLRAALGMPPDAPPPWLINMQRYGPPPSYATLRIPGLNAPIPKGAAYGYQAGGWGKPPVDDAGRPLYGDVFGEPDADAAAGGDGDGGGATGGGSAAAGGGSRRHWGELPEPGAAGAEAAAPSAPDTGLVLEEEEEGQQAAAGGAAAAAGEGAAAEGGPAATDGAASVALTITSGLETPDVVDVRKGARRAAGASGLETPESTAPPPELYRVLERRETALQGGILGTKHTYALPGAPGAPGAAADERGVAVALLPEELEHGLDAATLAQRYEAEAVSVAKTGGFAGGTDREDVSDLLEEHERKRKRKEAAAGGAAGAGGSGAPPAKKTRTKEFKF